MATNEAQASTDGNVKKIGELIGDIDFAMLTTVDERGEMQSRPMQTQRAEFNGDLYFFTYDNSAKARHIQANPRVNLGYSRPDKQSYVSLAGRAELVRDRAKMEQAWQPALKAWFPDGLDTPGIFLLKVAPTGAEYWDAPTSPVAHAIGFVKSQILGRPEIAGDNETLRLPQS